MPSYAQFTTTRATRPDLVALRSAVQSATSDATAIVYDAGAGVWQAKKTAAWSAADVSATQTALDTASPLTPQLTAQSLIDSLSIFDKAQDLTLLDEINILRSALSLAPRTVAQAIAAIRAKAGTL